jgi:hypothetical protein
MANAEVEIMGSFTIRPGCNPPTCSHRCDPIISPRTRTRHSSPGIESLCMRLPRHGDSIISHHPPPAPAGVEISLRRHARRPRRQAAHRREGRGRAQGDARRGGEAAQAAARRQPGPERERGRRLAHAAAAEEAVAALRGKHLAAHRRSSAVSQPRLARVSPPPPPPPH